MKTANLVKKVLVIGLCGAIIFSSCKKDHNNNQRMYTISGNANGAQMVPSVTGNGTGKITGTYNPNNGTLTYTTTWDSLSGGPTSGGFYNGASGVAGTAVGTPWAMGSNLTGTGSFSGTMNLTPAQAQDLKNGNWYYSMGTATNPGGEIRGQMTATQQ